MMEILVRFQIWLAAARKGIPRTCRGATSVEYALIAGVICVGVIGSYAFFTTKVGVTFNKVPTTWV